MTSLDILHNPIFVPVSVPVPVPEPYLRILDLIVFLHKTIHYETRYVAY
jgi:hypothetical protein